MAYETNESGRFEVVAQPFPVPNGKKWQVSTGGGVQPRWRSDGKELYFIAPDSKLMTVTVAVSGSTFEAGTAKVLFPTNTRSAGIFPKSQYAVGRDGRFLINTVLDDAASPITLLMNWNPAAKK